MGDLKLWVHGLFRAAMSPNSGILSWGSLGGGCCCCGLCCSWLVLPWFSGLVPRVSPLLLVGLCGCGASQFRMSLSAPSVSASLSPGGSGLASLVLLPVVGLGGALGDEYAEGRFFSIPYTCLL